MPSPQLPHAPPMHWIDEATLSNDGLTATAHRTLQPDHPFISDGQLLPSALIELMAQTAAAGSVIKHQAPGKKIRHGALVAIRDARFVGSAPVGATVILTAMHERAIGPLTSARLEARIGDTLIASARMTFHLTFV
jgi:predicted hotdog family 3-hydroxylacyl-ACP dehydratase